MKTGLLSLHARFADAIFAGEKLYEYRRKAPALHGPTRFVIYVTSPRREIVGEIVVDRVITDSPQKIWNETGPRGGIGKKDFFDYFSGCEAAHALHVRSAHAYPRNLGLEQLRENLPGGFTPPQYLAWLSPPKLSALHAL